MGKAGAGMMEAKTGLTDYWPVWVWMTNTVWLEESPGQAQHKYDHWGSGVVSNRKRFLMLKCILLINFEEGNWSIGNQIFIE